MLTRQRVSAVLALHEIDFLLGVSRSRAEIEHLRAAGIHYNGFFRFTADRMPPATFRGLWREHSAFLRAEAQHRGLAPPNPDDYTLVDGGRAFWDLRRFEQRPPC